MKKLLIVLLSLCLLVPLCVFVAGAEEPTAVAVVTIGTQTIEYNTFEAAVMQARSTPGSTLQLLADTEYIGGEIGGRYTIDLNSHTLKLDGKKTSGGTMIFTAKKGETLTITDKSAAKTGAIQAVDCDIIEMTAENKGDVKLQAGTYGFNTGSEKFIITNKSRGTVYLAGNLTLSYRAISTVYTGTIDAAGYSTSVVAPRLVYIAGEVKNGEVLISNAKESNFVFDGTYDQAKFFSTAKGSNIIIRQVVYYSWAIVFCLFAAAIVIVILTFRHGRKLKKQRNAITAAAVLPLPMLPTLLGIFNKLQTTWIIIGAAALGCALLYLLISCIVWRKQAKAAPAQKAEPVKEPEKSADEPAPAEEEPKEAAPAEEPVVVNVIVQEEEEPAEEPAPAEEEPVVIPVAEEPAKEEPAPAQPIVVNVIVNGASEKEEAPAAEVVPEAAAEEEGGATVFSVYKKSFLARMALAGDEVQKRYDTLRNALLRNKGVASRISWSYDSIKRGRTQLAKFAVTGKTLCLFLALDPTTLDNTKYNISDESAAKKYSDVPCRLRLTSKRSVKWGLELIAMLAEKNELVANPKYEDVAFNLPYKTTEELIAHDLIKKN